MKRTKFRTAYFSFLSFLVVIAACGGNLGTSDGTSPGTGAVVFTVALPGPSFESGGFRTAALNCGLVSSVEATVLDQNDVELANSGPPWPCSQRTGTITGVPEGSDRKVRVVARGFGGNILYQGTATGITVTGGQTTDAGTIVVSFLGSTVAWIEEGGSIVKISSDQPQTELLSVDQVNCSTSARQFAVDQSDGGLWFISNGSVGKIDADGRLVVLMEQDSPAGMAVDSRDGSVWSYEFRQFDSRLLKRTSVGLPLVFTDAGLDPSSKDNTMSWYPGDNSLWTADFWTSRVIKLFGTDEELDLYTFTGSNHVGISTSPEQPYSVSSYPGDGSGGAGHVWAGYSNGAVVRYSIDGTKAADLRPAGFFEVQHVSASISDGGVWAADETSARVAKFAATAVDNDPAIVNKGGLGFTPQTIESDPFDGGAWIGHSGGLVKISSSGDIEWTRSQGSVGAIATQMKAPSNNIIYVSKSGSDTSGTGEQASPFNTISKAISSANTGDTVFVEPGTYQENIAIGKDGLKILGSDKDTTVIEGVNANLNTVDGRSVNNGTISGFTITGSGSQKSGIFFSACSGFVIRGNNITNNGGNGITLEGGTDAIVEQNVIAGNAIGISISGSFSGLGTGDSHAVVRNNTIQNNASDGITRDWVSKVDRRCFITNNVIHGNGGDGIQTWSADIISNNSISQNTGFGINVAQLFPILSYNNLWNNLQGDYSGISPGFTDTANNPLYVNAASGDYHLQGPSLLRNAGDPDLHDAGISCSDSVNSRSDMGAYGGPWGDW